MTKRRNYRVSKSKLARQDEMERVKLRVFFKMFDQQNTFRSKERTKGDRIQEVLDPIAGFWILTSDFRTLNPEPSRLAEAYGVARGPLISAFRLPPSVLCL